MRRKGPDAYRHTNVLTADPKRLVIMCYEGAIAHLKIAQEKYSIGEFEAKGKALQKVLGAITELLSSLDFEKGGQIAENLKGIYSYMTHRLITGDVDNDPKAYEEVLGMLEELKETWETIFYGSKEDMVETAKLSVESAKPVHNQRVAL